MGVAYSLGSDSGKVSINHQTCTHCGLCAQVCPTETLQIISGKISIQLDTSFGCIGCGHCMMICPNHSVLVTGRRVSPLNLKDFSSKATLPCPENLEELFLQRRSIRQFTKQDIAPDIVDRIVIAASMAPMGIPPWEVGVTIFQGRESVRQLSYEVVKTYRRLLAVMDRKLLLWILKFFSNHSKIAQWTSFILPLGREIVAKHEQGTDAVFYDAPVVLLFHCSPFADTGDAMIACTYAMLFAQSLGLGTTMIGCAPPVLAKRKDLLKKYGIPTNHQPKIALILGYPLLSYKRGIMRDFI